MNNSKSTPGFHVVTLLYHTLKKDLEIKTHTDITGTTYRVEGSTDIIHLSKEAQYELSELVNTFQFNFDSTNTKLRLDLALELVRIGMPKRITPPDPGWTIGDMLKNYLDDTCGCITCRPNWYSSPDNKKMDKAYLGAITRGTNILNLFNNYSEGKYDDFDQLKIELLKVARKQNNSLTGRELGEIFNSELFVLSLEEAFFKPLKLKEAAELYIWAKAYSLTHLPQLYEALSNVYRPQMDEYLRLLKEWFEKMGYTIEQLEEKASEILNE